MSAVQELVRAERRLKEIDETFSKFALPHLDQCDVHIEIGGYSVILNKNAAPEMLKIIRQNLEREELNLKALLRKHKIIE